jgi:tape measure domain-containing protein
MINFDDIINGSGVLKGLNKLEQATIKYGDVAVAQNKRAEESLASLATKITEYRGQVAGLNNTQKGARTQVDGMKDGVDKLLKSYQNYQELLKRNQQQLDLNTASIKAIKGRLADLRVEYESLDRKEAQSVARRKEIAKETRATAVILNTLTKAIQEDTRATEAAENSYRALDLQTQKLRADLKGMKDAFDPLTGEINKHNRAAVEMQQQIMRNDRALKQADESMGLHGRSVGDYGNALHSLSTGGLQGVLGAVEDIGYGMVAGSANAEKYAARISVVAGGIAVAIAAISSFVETAEKMDRVDAMLKAVSRDSADFSRTQQFLLGLADKLGLEYSDLADTYKNLKAATKDTKLEGRETEKIYAAIATAGARLKLGNEAVEGSLRAVAKMVSSGNVQMDELRSELGEHLPGALRILGEALGISQTQLNKMVEQGEILAVDALPKLAEGYDKAYGLKQNEKIQSIAASTNRVTNETGLLVKTMNESKGIARFWATITSGAQAALRDIRLLVQDGAWGDLIALATPGGFALTANKRKDLRDKEDAVNEFSGLDAAARKKYLKDLEQAEADLIVAGETEKANKTRSIRRKLADIDRRAIVAERQESARQELIADKEAIEKNETDKTRFLKQSVKKRTAEIIALEKQLDADPQNEILAKKLDVYRKLDAEQKARDKEVADRLKTAKPDDDSAFEKLDKEIDKVSKKLEKQILTGGVNPKLADDLARLTKQAKEAREQLERIENGWFNKPVLSGKTVNPIFTSDLDRLGEKPLITGRRDKEGNLLTDAQIKAEEDKRLAAQTANLLKQGEILQEYGIKRYELEFDFSRTLTGLRNDQKAELLNLLQQQQEAEQAGNNKDLENLRRLFAQKKELYQQDAQDRREIAMKAVEIGSTLVNGLFDIEQQRNQNALVDLQKRKDYELSLVGDNEASKSAIERKYADQSKQIQRDQDLAARNQALFNIAINTAVEVSKSLSKPGLAVAIALLGAVQAGIVLSRPLPQYAEGKNVDDNYAGPAVVGEAGREIWMHNGQAQLVNQASVVNVGRNDVIYPNHITEKLLRGEYMEGSAIMNRNQRQRQSTDSMAYNRETYQSGLIARAMGWGGPSAKAIGKAVGDEIANHPKYALSWDKNGFNVYQHDAATRRQTQRNKHQIGKRS